MEENEREMKKKEAKNERKLRVLVGCEESQAVCIEFRKLGHEAYSCDLQECSGGHPEWHIKGDVLSVMNGGVFKTMDGEIHIIPRFDIGIFHPDCTYLTVSANRWLADQPKRKSGALVGQERREAVDRAVDFFMMIVDARIDCIAIENPIGIMSTRYRKPNQIIQPYEFGHPEPKATCLWMKNLPNLTPTDIVKPEYYCARNGERYSRIHFMSSNKKDRAKLRSKTYAGIAQAMATQWSEYILNK